MDRVGFEPTQQLREFYRLLGSPTPSLSIGKKINYSFSFHTSFILICPRSLNEEDGCIRYDYYLSEKDPNELLLIEQWESKEDQQVHLTQPHMAAMRKFKDDYILKTTLEENTQKLFKIIKENY